MLDTRHNMAQRKEEVSSKIGAYNTRDEKFPQGCKRGRLASGPTISERNENENMWHRPHTNGWWVYICANPKRNEPWLSSDGVGGRLHHIIRISRKDIDKNNPRDKSKNNGNNDAGPLDITKCKSVFVSQTLCCAFRSPIITARLLLIVFFRKPWTKEDQKWTAIIVKTTWIRR